MSNHRTDPAYHAIRDRTDPAYHAIRDRTDPAYHAISNSPQWNLQSRRKKHKESHPWTHKTPVKESIIKFENGAPRSKKCYPEHIVRVGRLLSSAHGIVSNLRMLYSYEVLEAAYPRFTMRAGLIITCKSFVLMIREHERPCVRNGVPGIIPSHIGFPKGGRSPSDISAIDTALREGYEETGIIFQDAQFAKSAAIIPRPEIGIEELFVYFIVMIDSFPAVKIDTEELCGYEWVDSAKLPFYHMPTVTRPTDCLLRWLENVDFNSI
jgi:8-oxo-dGTP pyrophosphatase MutT (NUDIX family)